MSITSSLVAAGVGAALSGVVVLGGTNAISGTDEGVKADQLWVYADADA